MQIFSFYINTVKLFAVHIKKSIFTTYWLFYTFNKLRTRPQTTDVKLWKIEGIEAARTATSKPHRAGRESAATSRRWRPHATRPPLDYVPRASLLGSRRGTGIYPHPRTAVLVISRANTSGLRIFSLFRARAHLLLQTLRFIFRARLYYIVFRERRV